MPNKCPPGKRASHGPLARYVKLRVAHAPGMLGTFSPPLGVSDPDMHPDACRDRSLVVTFEVSGGKNVPGIPGACAIRNFAYLGRSPLAIYPLSHKRQATPSRSLLELA